jgi:starch synthase
MEKKRVLIVTQEMKPYFIKSAIAQIARELPQHIQDSGMEIRVLMPRFSIINERRHRLHEVVRLSGINISIQNDDHPLVIKVASLPGARMQVYFLDNEDMFKRKGVFGDEQVPFYDDNAERMIFFCKGVMETVKKFGWAPHIIHCHGWMTSLIPYYLKTSYKADPIFKNSKVIYSVYENTFKNKLHKSFLAKAPVKTNDPEFEVFSKSDNTSLHLGGITLSDGVIVGSENIAKEVQALLDKNGKPVLAYKGEEEFLEAYQSFYGKFVKK